MPVDAPKTPDSVLRITVAIALLGLAAFFAIGFIDVETLREVIQQRITTITSTEFEADHLVFELDLDRAVDVANERNLPLLVDFTGVNCVNCRRMEAQMALPQNKDRLQEFVLVQLFTDDMPGDLDKGLASGLVERNRKLQRDWIGDVALPSYAVVTPAGDNVLARMIGHSDLKARFTSFLEHGQAKWKRR